MSDTYERTFKCKVCAKPFKQNGQMMRHVREVHMKVNRIRPDPMPTPKVPESFPCRLCNFVATNQQGLSKHLNCHTKDYRCDICGKSFSAGRVAAKLWQHKLICQKMIDKRLASEIFCRQCNAVFTNKKLHKSHESKCVTPKCIKCSQVFKNNIWLARHKCPKFELP